MTIGAEEPCTNKLTCAHRHNHAACGPAIHYGLWLRCKIVNNNASYRSRGAESWQNFCVVSPPISYYKSLYLNNTGTGEKTPFYKHRALDSNVYLIANVCSTCVCVK